MFRLSFLLFLALCSALLSEEVGAKASPWPVAADSLTRLPLGNASVFDRNGRFAGICRSDGGIACVSAADYPITVRYMGYDEKAVNSPVCDTVFLRSRIAELPELVVSSKQKKMLHILAYMREYSTLASYSDTVSMFREKMVDYMLPMDTKMTYNGWRFPRVLNSRSYYRFTDAGGLDSVSDRCNNHFSWADWVGIAPKGKMPPTLLPCETGTDTINGKYSATEIWHKNDEHVSIDLNILADTLSRKWVPNIASFFRKDDMDFEQFRMHLNFNDVYDGEVSPLNLTGYSCLIESRGRGLGMFRFGRHDQPIFVSTYAEVYILDKEFISVKEARKWEKAKFSATDFDILEPEEAPDLQPGILALINRVNGIDATAVRLDFVPDHRLAGRAVSKYKYNLAYRAFSFIKTVTGISALRARYKNNKSWKEFRQTQKALNNSRPMPFPADTVPSDSVAEQDKPSQVAADPPGDGYGEDY